MKLCVDPNGQIKLHAKQKYEILSATSGYVTLPFVVRECEWVLVRILLVLLSCLVPLQIQYKFYKHVKQMEYNNNEH